jgi:predicted phosphodiesterase
VGWLHRTDGDDTAGEEMTRWLHLSDIHGGSKEAPATHEGDAKRNPIMDTLTDEWYKMVDTVGRVDVVVLNGDLIDGVNYKEEGVGTWTTDIKEQKDDVRDLIRSIRCRNYIVIRGSQYHRGKNYDGDSAIAEALGCEKAYDEVKITSSKDKVSMHLCHHINVSGIQSYRTTAIAREMMVAVLGEEHFGKFDVIVRGHAHYYCLVDTGSHYGVILPCWKGRDAYVKQKSLCWNPHIGYVTMETKDGVISIDRHVRKLRGKHLIEEVKI